MIIKFCNVRGETNHGIILATRRSWIRIDDAIPTGARTEVLLLDTAVAWNDNELRLTQARMIKEETP